jgi:2-keto-4-pentenoate hydratase/2-oxohepta-3-ene-1,7-dioic acid hydratase in catechol pathway
VYYKGNPGSLATHEDDIPIPSYADALDIEFELAMVIGQGGINIAPERALDHVFGYMIYNDFSERTIQAREMTVGLGPAKGKDFVRGHVLGPHLVTTDEIPDIYNLHMVARVNDEVWCDSNSGTIHWKFEQMIAHVSTDEVLRPGEVLGSGTVGGGSGAERGTLLRRGDVVELEVERLGVLRNRVI